MQQEPILIHLILAEPESQYRKPVAKFKEFERWFKFKPRIKYGWFH